MGLAASAFPSWNHGSHPILPSEDPFYEVPEDYKEAELGGDSEWREMDTKFGLMAMEENVCAYYQVMYRTSDSHGNPLATVTSILIPFNADYEKLLSYHIAEDSNSFDCSPSFSIQAKSGLQNVMSQLEVMLIIAALDEGWVVNVPDYEGPRSSFAAGRLEGRAVLDSLRTGCNLKISLV